MSSSSSSSPSPSNHFLPARSRLIERFADEWKQGRQPRIDDYLDEASSDRLGRLIALVGVDLEHRLEAGESVRLEEDYLGPFRAALDGPSAVEVIVHDFTVRQRLGLNPHVEDYLERFPQYRDELESRLAEVVDRSSTKLNRASTMPVLPGTETRTSLGPPSPPPTLQTSPSGRGPIVPVPADLKPLQSDFVFLEKLGEGGMGQVWRVWHKVLHVERALKVIRPQYAHEPELIERMVREARALAQLSNPHAVQIGTVSAKGVHYIEMEYVQGKTLKDVLKPRVPMSLEWTAELLDQLCDVLQDVHDKGIIHRDLKPANLMLVDDTCDGEVCLKVVDFGLAKLDSGPDAFKTAPNRPVGGTPMYMSPEQAEGKDVSPRSDLFSVGLILYELLTGTHPFDAGRRVSIEYYWMAIVKTPTPRFQERNPEVKVPRGIEKLVLKCLEKNPEDRPASAAELAREFRCHVPRRKPAPPPPRRPWFRLVAAGIVVLICGTVLGILLMPVLFRDRLKVTADPSHLEIQGSEPEAFVLEVTPDVLVSKVKVEEVGAHPDWIKVERGNPNRRGPIFYVEVTRPELIPRTHKLTFVARYDGEESPVSIRLDIRPPDPSLPSKDWRPLGNDLVTYKGKFYPRQLERTIEGVKEPLVVLLIEESAEGGPPFYIMRDKVWVGLFEAFAREAEDVAGGPWREEHEPLLPVRNVTGPQAELFARWLGGPGQGFLPTCEQWDQAAGRNQKPRRAAPFPGDPDDPVGIAVGLPDPLPVGAAHRDISPYGCRDMSGNGWERTRLKPGFVDWWLRGKSFGDKCPLQFKELDNAIALPFKDPDPETGFRVVILLEPEN
jgi:serine/threonine-protein kinase